MTTTPYDEEFAAVLAPRLRGQTVPQRIAIVRELLADARTEGTVPVGDRMVSVSARAWAPAADASLDGSPTPRPRGSLLRWALAGILSVVLIPIVLAALGTPTAPTASASASTPVRAETDGGAAPISLVVADTTFAVRAFDGTKGWPDPAATPGAALWGHTTINVVLGLDATVPATAALLDALTGNQALTLRRADGSQTVYRVRDRHTVDRSAVEYAAQQEVGLTLVGFRAGSERVIVQAVPADAPITAGTLGDVAIDAAPLAWVPTADGTQRTLGLTMTLAPGATGPLTVTTAAGMLLTALPAGPLPPTLVLIADPLPGATSLDLVVDHADATLTLGLPIPEAPTLGVQWGAATRLPDTLAVGLTLAPSGPLVLDGGTCTLPDGQTVPLTLDGLALPALVSQRKEVIARCPVPAATRGLVTVTLQDAAADVQLP